MRVMGPQFGGRCSEPPRWYLGCARGWRVSYRHDSENASSISSAKCAAALDASALRFTNLTEVCREIELNCSLRAENDNGKASKWSNTQSQKSSNFCLGG